MSASTCTATRPLGQDIDFGKHPDAAMCPLPMIDGIYRDRYRCPHCHRVWSGDAIDILKQQKEQDAK